MRRNHSVQPKASIKYFVEVNGEEKGTPKGKKFQNRDDALKFAERHEARNLRVMVTNLNGKEIYCSQ